MKTINLAGFLFMLSPTFVSAVNLLPNGSFESPDFHTDPMGYRIFVGGSTAIGAWKIIGETDITTDASGFGASDGHQFADLSVYAGYNKGLQSQPIAVNPNTWYSISFDLGSLTAPGTGGCLSSQYACNSFGASVGVIVNGDYGNEKRFISTAASQAYKVNWSQHSFNWYSGNNSQADLTFLSRDPGAAGLAGYNYISNAFLDNIAFSPATINTPVVAVNPPLPQTPAPAANIQAASVTNLVTNGSFETPSLGANPYQMVFNAATNLSGWTVVASEDADGWDRAVALGATDPTWFKASDGKQVIDLAGFDGFNKGIRSNTIAVVSGQRYTLSFDIGSFYQYQSTVGVSFTSGVWEDGSQGEKTFSSAAGPIAAGQTAWRRVSVSWIAKQTTTTQISLLGRNPGVANTTKSIYNQNIMLDNVSLSAAPQ